MAMFGRSAGMPYPPMYKLPLIHLSIERLVYSSHGQNRGEQVFGFDTRVHRTQQNGYVERFEALGCGRFGEMSPMFLENVGVQGSDALVFANTVSRFFFYVIVNRLFMAGNGRAD